MTAHALGCARVLLADFNDPTPCTCGRVEEFKAERRRRTGVALAVGSRVHRAAEDAGTVVEAVSDRVRVQWDHGTGPRRPLEWLPLALVKLVEPDQAEEPES